MPPRPDPESDEPESARTPRRWWGAVAAAAAGTVVRLLSPETGRSGGMRRSSSSCRASRRSASCSATFTNTSPTSSLFYLIMRGWTAVAGQGDAALRSLPLLLSVLLISLVAWVGARAFAPGAGLAAAVIVAVHPNLAFHSVQVRPYSALMLLAIGSAYALWRIVETASAAPRWRCGLGAGHGVPPSLELAAAGGTGSGVGTRGGDQGAEGPGLGAARRVRVGRRRDRIPADGTDISAARSHGGASRASNSVPWTLSGASPMSRLRNFESRVGVAVLVLAFGAMVMRRTPPTDLGDRRLRAYVLLGLLPLLAVAIALPVSGASNLLVPHTLTTLVPFVALGIGAGIAAMLADRRYLEFALLAGLLLAALGLDYQRLQQTEKSNAAALADAIESEALPSDVVIVAPDRYASSFNYYFDGKRLTRLSVGWASRGGSVRRLLRSNSRLIHTIGGRRSIRCLRAAGCEGVVGRRRDDFGDTTPLQDGLPPEDSPLEHPVRTDSLAADRAQPVREVYGAPDTVIVPAGAAEFGSWRDWGPERFRRRQTKGD